jgi:hypothetical protein
MDDLKVIDLDFNLLASIDDYESIQNGRKLHEIGSTEIHINYAKRGADQLIPGRIAFVNARRPYIITGVEISETTRGVQLIARGQQLKGIVDQRISLPDATDDASLFGYDRFPAVTAPDAAAETVMKHYADKHLVNPTDTNRKMTGLVIAADQARGIAMRWSTRFESLAAVLKSIGEWSGIGYEITLDLANKQFVFDVIAGADRTSSSDTPVVFSVAFGNVDSTKYALDNKPLVTVAYAGGAGENEGRLIQAVNRDDTITAGWARRESWLDCGNIEYLDDLVNEAKYRMKGSIAAETLTGDIAATGPFVYGVDWDLGDTVTVQSRALGIERDSQITEVVETFEGGKHDVNITFGKRQKSILDEIRKIEVIR